MSIDAAAQTGHVFPTSDHLSAEIGWEVPQAKAKAKDIGMFAEEEPSFWDLLDVVNPLQHIPIVNTIYRELTGDEIGVAARLAGGTLFGGPIGFAAAAVNAAVEQDTGKDIGGHVLAMFSDDEVPPDGTPSETGIAAVPPAPVAAIPLADAPAPDYLPDITMMQQSPGSMMFTASGPVSAAAPPQPIAVPEAVAQAAEPARFFPVPPRVAAGSGRDVPQVRVPISTSGNRSHVPITGLNPAANAPTIAVSEATTVSDGRESAAWFGSAMKAGLDKYEQAARLNRGKDAAEPVSLQ